MVNYRRNFLPGGTFFFTVTLQNRKSNILVSRVDLLKDAIRSVKAENPFKLNAYVILPEHLHMLWTLPPGDFDYSNRWKKIKTYFSKKLNHSGVKLQKSKFNEYQLWQRRFWEHTIKDAADYEQHVNYIHYNPVKHKLVDNLYDWPYSSIHEYIKRGILTSDWAMASAEYTDFKFGE